jgi:type III pantothenate kinase
MNLCIDIGNTFTKIAVFDGDSLLHQESFTSFGIDDVERIKKNSGVKRAIISSVKDDNPQFYAEIGKHLEKLVVLGSETKVPVKNEYKTPETLGKDRLAVVVGANYLYPDLNLLVIDAGSAITFDFIDEKSSYKGGNIAPGLSMRFRALNEFTSRLPLLAPQNDYALLGGNTSEAIISGVQNSIVFEVDTYISELEKLYPGLIALITGGDAKFFDNKLKNTIFVIPNLVLIGLNRILNFNA